VSVDRQKRKKYIVAAPAAQLAAEPLGRRVHEVRALVVERLFLLGLLRLLAAATTAPRDVPVSSFVETISTGT